MIPRDAYARAGEIDIWPEPDRSLLSPDRAEPPAFPGAAVFGGTWAGWIAEAAEAKGAPPDFVAGGLLAAAASRIGNARWPSPWKGWAEPPHLWVMAIGAPSSSKTPGLSPAMDAVRVLQRTVGREHAREHDAWKARAELAKPVRSAWEGEVRKAAKRGEDAPEKPDAADPGSEPVLERLFIGDATIEAAGARAAEQPRGLLMFRDELAGMLANLSRYANGGSDGPFWLEAWNGKSYPVDRKGGPPLMVERLAIGILGGIQPDRLSELLLRAADDGMLARFLPVFPARQRPRRPIAGYDEMLPEQAFRALGRLAMPEGDDGPRPWIVPFSEAAADRFAAFRDHVAEIEDGEAGLLLSFIGKCPGFVVRLSLVLAFLDWSLDEGPEPQAIEREHVERAVRFVQGYALPMARRAYTEVAAPREERGAQALARLIVEKGWSEFTSRDVARAKRQGLRAAAEITPALDVLVQAGVVAAKPPERTGGRPRLVYLVNPKLRQAASGAHAGDRRDERDRRPSGPAFVASVPSVTEGNGEAAPSPRGPSVASVPFVTEGSGETVSSRSGDATADTAPPELPPLDAYADDLGRGEPEGGPCEDRATAWADPDAFDPELWG
ncbi:MAG: DUF3987 domain-containing protein [Paracoccaceae bacterium]